MIGGRHPAAQPIYGAVVDQIEVDPLSNPSKKRSSRGAVTRVISKQWLVQPWSSTPSQYVEKESTTSHPGCGGRIGFAGCLPQW